MVCVIKFVQYLQTLRVDFGGAFTRIYPRTPLHIFFVTQFFDASGVKRVMVNLKCFGTVK